MRLLNVLQQHADSGRASMPVGRWGLVTSANTSTMTVKVTLQPEGVQTGWLPVASASVGSGWGLVHMPPVGTQVFCMPDAGDDTSYIVIGATWSSQALPPTGYLQGEQWLVHASGSYIKLKNDGTVTIRDASGTSLSFSNNGIATLTASATVQLNAPSVHTSGNVVVGTGATGTFATPGGVTVTVRDGIVTNIY